MKPTLKKYWEANSSTERIEIVEAAFTLIEELEDKIKKSRAMKGLTVKFTEEGIEITNNDLTLVERAGIINLLQMDLETDHAKSQLKNQGYE